MKYLATLAVIFSAGIGSCGCSGQPQPPSLRKTVGSALVALDCPRGSRIDFMQDELAPGSTVTPLGDCPGEAAGLPAFVVPEPGHLIFIDEQPGYDWVHRAKLVFFPRQSPGEAKVIFRDTPKSCFHIKSPDGQEVKATWVKR